MKLAKIIRQSKILLSLVNLISLPRARDIVSQVEKYLSLTGKILDIGAGSCQVADILTKKGFAVTPLDVIDQSLIAGLSPQIYDGKKIPFADNSFDTALIITVLHHTSDPSLILAEAKRVAREIVVMEDVYTGWWHKLATYFMDSLLNFEFFGHPHTNKTDVGWREEFSRQGLIIKQAEYHGSFLVMRHATYLLKKRG